MSIGEHFNRPNAFAGRKVILPPNHQAGMPVPKGGSMCANCEYLKDAGKRICGNPNFIRWNGSATIPGKIDEYCSDWYEPADNNES